MSMDDRCAAAMAALRLRREKPRRLRVEQGAQLRAVGKLPCGEVGVLGPGRAPHGRGEHGRGPWCLEIHSCREPEAGRAMRGREVVAEDRVHRLSSEKLRAALYASLGPG